MFAETLKWSFAEMLIDYYFWGDFFMIFAEIVFVNDMKMILIKLLIIDVFFFKKFVKWMCMKSINGPWWRKKMIKWM